MLLGDKVHTEQNTPAKLGPTPHPPFSLANCAGLQLLGKIDEKFVEVVDVYEPLESGQRCARPLFVVPAPALSIATLGRH